MARNQLMRILNRSDKGASRAYGSGGVLSRLWAQMLKDLDVNIARWNDYMHSFVTDPRNGIAPTKKDQTSARGNLTKEFARPQMTWKVYMKALRFLQVIKVEIGIKCHYASGAVSTHATTVDFGMPSKPTTTFMEDIQSQHEPEDQGFYTEIEDDEFVRDFFVMMSQPFMFPFGNEDAPFDESEVTLPEHPQGNDEASDPFGGSRLAKMAYTQYLADKQQMDLIDHEQRDD
jgi:hypothetical protein